MSNPIRPMIAAETLNARLPSARFLSVGFVAISFSCILASGSDRPSAEHCGTKICGGLPRLNFGMAEATTPQQLYDRLRSWLFGRDRLFATTFQPSCTEDPARLEPAQKLERDA